MNILFFISFGGLVPLCVDGSGKRKLAITIISSCLFFRNCRVITAGF